MKEVVFRFVVGGLIVSVFAVLGELFEPKSFAGIFSAAPSVALATLAFTISNKGKLYAVTELRSTLVGAIALFVYASLVSRVLIRHNVPAKLGASLLLAVWVVVAIGLWALVLV